MKWARINKLLVSLHSIMANDYFEFKHFIVRQDRCAMKVGTDGTLLGAWAQAPEKACRILDIGTGTGLIALMMAQRFPEAHVFAVEIDEEACEQARGNVMESPFSERISILNQDVTTLTDAEGFDAIVCNPPYFVDSLPCPDEQRRTARHAVTLTYEELIHMACKLLKEDGLLSVVIPSESRQAFEACVRLDGLFISRVFMIKTTPKKAPKRQLIEFKKILVDKLIMEEGVLEIAPNQRSKWYQELTKNFYIR